MFLQNGRLPQFVNKKSRQPQFQVKWKTASIKAPASPELGTAQPHLLYRPESNYLYYFQMAERFGILFPNTSVCSTFGQWVLGKGNKMALFCPSEPHRAISKSIVADLSVLAIERSWLRNERNDSLCILSEPNFSDCEFLLVPNIDCQTTGPDKEYVNLCVNTFR